MELVGIENEAEFFPSGTLSDVLKDELREIISHWSHDDSTIDPVKRLSDISTTTLLSLASIRRASGKRRTDLVQEMRTSLLLSLGYERKYQEVSSGLDENPVIPLAGAVLDTSGKNALWIIETPAVGPEDEASDPLDSNIEGSQISTGSSIEDTPMEVPIGELLGEGVFDLLDGPRYVLVLGQSQIILVDKRKWPARSVLRFNLQEIFGRRDHETLTVMACMLSREARVPEQGIPISDRLEEEAQRNANAVTTSLKRTVRDAIEILGQEALDVSEGKYPSTFPDRSRKGIWIDGAYLSQECLKYMYRLLFLFYAEANPRLGLLDLKNPVYKRGYSLEGLREFECVPLRTTEDRENTFLWDSLQCTLRHIYEGIDCIDKNKNNGFFLPPVKVSLLDPKSTPLLSSLSLRNEAIQKVIRLLSLQSTKRRTGRISYAKLGIGQLGAVYETLISFAGTVAKEDLIQVKSHKSGGKPDNDSNDQESNIDNENNTNIEDDGKKVSESRGNKYTDSEKVDPLEPCWFAPHRRFDEFGPKRVVYRNGEALIHPKGSFIYRLSGRDREKSASFYTPEPLARTLVKYALAERCDGMAADDLLQLKILEPAMGSAAFLVEVTNQIADLYLERKQKEVRELIPQEKVVEERQRVRAYITDRNCFGVDLNPIAVELASISLWLNSLHAGDFSPWSGNQLYVGNSLFGARRAYYSPELLEQKKVSNRWLKRKPIEIGWHREFVDGNIWHWLLPAKGMANYENKKSISPLFGKEQKIISAWRKGGFFDRFEVAEIELMQNLSKIANQLYKEVADHLKDIRKQTSDQITLWPNNEMSGNVNLKFYDKESLNEHLVGDKIIIDTLPFKRLKTAMDAWCALWVWPLEKADLLPSRKDFLHGMSLVLEGKISENGDLEIPSFDQGYEAYRDFHNIMTQSDRGHNSEGRSYEHEETVLFEETNLETLINRSEWLKHSIEIASRERFIHFDLIFSDVMRERGGFDLIVGNPPWAKPYWSEGNLLAEIDPLHVGLSASKARKVTSSMFKSVQENGSDRKLKSILSYFVSKFVSTKGEIEAISSNVMNPFVGGGVTNLYHCFIDLSFRLVSKDGRAALIHQDGHLISSKMREFRKNWYARISRHFKFRNEFKHKMFSEIGNRVRFSLNVYRGTPEMVKFDAFCDAFLVSQIEDSYSHSGTGEVGGIKKDDGTWNTSGHKMRILKIDQDVLKIINLLSESEGVPVDESRLILPYSVCTLDLFQQLSKTRKFATIFSQDHDTSTGVDGVTIDLDERVCQISRHLSESDAQIDGTMSRDTGFRTTERMILQGPHLSVGNPICQTPRRICETHRAYDHVDLTLVPDDYVPRTNFVPDTDIQDFRSRLPSSSWDRERNHSDYYRVAAREMISRDSERSLISALICPGVTHVSSVLSAAFDKDQDLISTLAQFVSLPLDYLVKISGMEHLKIETLPWLEATDTACSRSLRLCCLTSAYADIWNRCASGYSVMPWSSTDARLELEGAVEGPALWQREAGFRTEFARRMALVEIDVIIAQDFGFTLDQLIEMYTTYFPVLMENERGTWYDQNGRIAWTCSKSLPGVGWLNEDHKIPSKTAWAKVLDSEPSELVCTAIDDTMPNGPREVERRFIGPFTLCDRIADYRRAWAHFEKLKAQGGM